MSDKAKWTPGPWIVDECPDANGHFTIRRADGTPNGNTDAQPIATVYCEIDAALLEAAPLMAEALAALLEVAFDGPKEPKGSGCKEGVSEWRKRVESEARAALRAAGAEDE